MAKFPYSYAFSWVIALCGVLSFLFMIGNLWYWGLHRYPADARIYVSDSNIRAGKAALQTYGCGGCHYVPGIANATGRVGPKLDDYDQQIYVAGVLTNTADNLAAWIQNPQKYSPNTVMPNLGVSEEEARAMASYLYEGAD